MMVKKRGLIFTVVLVLILACANMFLFLNKGRASYTAISGNFVEDIPKNLFSSNLSFIIFAAQWVILVLIILVVYSKFLKRRKDTLTKQDYNIIKQRKTKSETDLDILYELIKNKKRLNLTTISKVFGITKDNALKWAKILENHRLVKIDYPTFRTPEVKIYEEKTKEKPKKEEKGKTKKGKQKEKAKPEKGKTRKAGKKDKKKGNKKASIKKK